MQAGRLSRNRLKPIAVVVGAAGFVAVAAAVSPALGGPSLKSLVKKEVAKQLAGKTGPPGPQGAQGLQGLQGTQGPAGGAGRLDSAVATVNDPANDGQPAFTQTLVDAGPITLRGRCDRIMATQVQASLEVSWTSGNLFLRAFRGNGTEPTLPGTVEGLAVGFSPKEIGRLTSTNETTYGDEYGWFLGSTAAAATSGHFQLAVNSDQREAGGGDCRFAVNATGT